ncbi:hypothetical protein E4U61_003711, partial [Claviceps capensis]
MNSSESIAKWNMRSSSPEGWMTNLALKSSVMVLARAYMSGESARDYCRLFQTLFKCLEKNQVTVKWKHAEDEGIVGVTVDQDVGGIKGLGLYLAGKYSHKSKGWEYHIERTVRLCEVHYKRGITTVSKKRNVRRGYARAKEMMWSLLTVETPPAFYVLCGAIQK